MKKKIKTRLEKVNEEIRQREVIYYMECLMLCWFVKPRIKQELKDLYVEKKILKNLLQ